MLSWSEFGPSVQSTALAIGGLLLGLGFAVTAVLLRYQSGQRGNSDLFVALTLSWLAGSVGTRGLGAVTQPLLWLGSFPQALGAAAFLRYPEPRLERVDRIFIAVLTTALGVIGAGRLLTSTPSTWERPMGDIPWLTLSANPDAYSAWTTARHATWAVGGLVLLPLLVRRWMRLGQLERRALAPILLTAGSTIVFTMTRFVEPWFPPAFTTITASVRAYSAAAVAVAFAVSALQMRMARTAVADLAADLATSSGVENVQHALRHRFGDQSLEVWYWVSDIDGFVDSDGRPRELSHETDPRQMTREVRNSAGDLLALVLLDVRLGRYPKLVDSALTVSRFAIENAQLQADLRQQVVVVSQTRGRLLQTSLEQRRQLERDLHDGAQQRLLGVGMRLGALEARTTDAVVAANVATVRQELALALEELRNLAHGLYPAVLTQSGLAPALEAVAERLPIPVQLRVEPERWRPDVESTAYLIVCEALTNVAKHAGSCSAHVSVQEKDGELVIDVTDNGVGIGDPSSGILPAMHDRAAAMNGRLSVTSSPGAGTRVVARIPCE